MLKKFFHIALSLYLLAITAGVAVNKHYCMGDVVSTSLFLKAQSCSDMDESMDNHCCNDVLAFYQLEDDFISKSNLDFHASADFNLIIPEYTFLKNILLPNAPSEEKNKTAYSPPLLSSNIPVEVQSFLL